MRRMFVTAVLSAALLGTAACGSTPTNAAATPTTAAPSSAPSVKLEDKAATCAEVTKLEDDIKGKILAAMPALLAAANDPAKGEAAAKALVGALEGWQTQVATLSAAAGDAQVKALLVELNTAALKNLEAMKAAGNDVDKVTEAIDDESLTKVQGQLETLCK